MRRWLTGSILEFRVRENKSFSTYQARRAQTGTIGPTNIGEANEKNIRFLRDRSMSIR